MKESVAVSDDKKKEIIVDLVGDEHDVDMIIEDILEAELGGFVSYLFTNGNSKTDKFTKKGKIILAACAIHKFFFFRPALFANVA